MTASSFRDSFGDGPIDPAALAARLGAPPADLARALGLAAGTLAPTGWRAAAVQGRLREFADILDAVLPWCGSPPAAFAWFRAETIPGFGRTPGAPPPGPPRRRRLCLVSRRASGRSAAIAGVPARPPVSPGGAHDR